MSVTEFIHFSSLSLSFTHSLSLCLPSFQRCFVSPTVPNQILRQSQIRTQFHRPRPRILFFCSVRKHRPRPSPNQVCTNIPISLSLLPLSSLSLLSLHIYIFLTHHSTTPILLLLPSPSNLALHLLLSSSPAKSFTRLLSLSTKRASKQLQLRLLK